MAMLMLVTTSCNEMDQYPHNGVTPDNLTEDDASLLLNGLYRIVQNKPTADGYMTGDIIGGDIIRGGATGITDPRIMIRDLITPESGFVSGPWNGYYTGLYQVNSLMQSLNSMLPSDSRNEMIGIASYFRALIYFNIVSRWAEVPILEVPTTSDVAASTEAEGWAFVEKNLETAIEFCPSFTDKNYVSKEAAMALMARTKLFMGKKAEAAALSEELIKNVKFQLSPFSDIFRGNANKEEIFTFINLMEESGVNLGVKYYSRSAANGGSYTYAPTPSVMNMFDIDDNRRTISIDTQETNDVINKYSGGEAHTDPLIISRLGEMYLISAECLGINGGGLSRLNELRQARGIQPISVADDNALLDAVIDERRHELIGEGFRWFDLVRTGKYESTLGLDIKYSRLPIPSREMQLNQLLKQNSYWN